MRIAWKASRPANGRGLRSISEHEGTVPDLRTERSGVVESELSPVDSGTASFALEFGCGEW